ncbi:hypothetical protein B0O99DRAFT_733099 [Bisporella sp. PMI_857]|nr:hypothetical protein B0O99DRAFT_733099 [Bisporella sp. PMI_857]
MSTFDLLAEQLSSANSDVNIRSEVATQLSDNIEHYVSGPTYTEFLKKLVPIFINCLKGPPVFIGTSLEQKLRICILTILYQLPKNSPGPFELYTEDVVNLLISLVRIDNEENASLCIKIIIDIMRHQTKVLGDKLQPFLALTDYMFDQINLVARDQLDNQAPHNSTPGMSLPESSQTSDNSPQSGSSTASISDIDLEQPTLPLPKAMASFKVLGECPIIVQSIFKVYQSSDSLDINLIFLRIKSILLLQAKPQEQAHSAAATNGTIFTGVSPNIGNRRAFGGFIGTQVKALSLLAYLLRISEEQLTKLTEFNDFLQTLPDIVIRLLKDCPREKSAVRKELWIAIRSIVNFNFRRIFLKQIDELLDERILLGDGLTVYEAQRPLAYSMLADLIHHVRDALEPPQIRKTVEVYIKNLQDNSPGTSFQTMSAKLLLNMAECIAKMPNKADARHYLIMILNAIGDKFTAMNREYPNAVKLSKLYVQQSVDTSPDNYLAHKEQLPDWDEIDIFTATPIKTSNPRDRGADPVADNKFLFKAIIKDLKNIFDLLKACYVGSPIGPTNAPAHGEDTSYGFTTEEIQVIRKLSHAGANFFRYYESDKPAAKLPYTNDLELIANHYISGTKEEKDPLKEFVAILLCFHPTTLLEIFYDQIATALDRVPQLQEIFPTPIQQYKQMIHCNRFFNIHAKGWFYLLLCSFRVAQRDGLGRPFQKISFAVKPGLSMEPSVKMIHVKELDLEKGLLRTQNSRPALYNRLIRCFQKILFTVWSSSSIKRYFNPTYDETRNSPYQHEQFRGSSRSCQKIDFAARSGLIMEPSVKIVIDAVIDVEERVGRTTFQTILNKHRNYFPREVFSFLVGKIGQQKYGRFLAQILEHPDSGPVRKVVVENIEVLIRSSEDMGAEKDIWAINSIHVMHSLCKFEGDREWMGENDIITWLNKSGKNIAADLRANTLPPHLRLAAEQAIEQLMVIFIKFMEYYPTALDALFSFIESVANGEFRQTRPLLQYIYYYIICNDSIEFWKTIVMRGLEVYASKSTSQRTKTFLLHNIVNPIVARDVMRISKQESPKSPRLVDKAVIESIHTKIWKVSLGDPNDDLTQPGIDHTRMEALQLTAMLVKYHHSILYDMRQDIINFGLAYSCLEDIIIKGAANVVISYCIAHFEIPVKITQQVYTSLLESSYGESRALVMPALELIAPVLPNLCNAVPDDRNPIWAAPRRILTEEMQDVQQTIVVFCFLVKHADLFYENRDKFIILIVKSLRAIAQLPNPSNQSKQLVLQMMTLVWQWEQRRVEGRKYLSTEKCKFEDSNTSEYNIPTWARAEMINYLAEFTVSLRRYLPLLSADAKAANASNQPSAEMINSMSLLHSLLHPQYWGDVDIDLSNIIEILLVGDPTDDKWVNSMMNALQVARIIANVKPHILKSMPLLEKLLEMSQKSDNSEICVCLYDEADINGLKMKSLWSVGVNLELWR